MSIYRTLSELRWACKHFDGLSTNRQVTARDMRRCVALGYAKLAGQGVAADGDGFAIEPERWADIYVITDAGRAELARREAAAEDPNGGVR